MQAKAKVEAKEMAKANAKEERQEKVSMMQMMSFRKLSFVLMKNVQWSRILTCQSILPYAREPQKTEHLEVR